MGEPVPLQKGALTTAEVCEALGLGQLKNRSWHVQGAISIRGEGLYEGLDWYVAVNVAKIVAENNTCILVGTLASKLGFVSPGLIQVEQHSQVDWGTGYTGLSTECYVQACKHTEEYAAIRPGYQRNSCWAMTVQLYLIHLIFAYKDAHH